MNLSIFGLGYVGAVSLACLARDGHHVVGVDIDASKLALIAEGRTPVVEEGMVDLMAAVAKSGRVRVTTDAIRAVADTDISFVCVGTPSATNGSQDQGAVLRLAADLGRGLAKKVGTHVVVFRSTLVPGTVEDVLIPILERESGRKEGVDFHVAFQPEFLREGTSIKDYDHPPFTIAGTRGTAAADALQGLFAHTGAAFVKTSIRAAEMVKYCCNNFHALKITFANETARLCESLGVDPMEVMDLVCRDTQLNISRAYLRPGYAFGGSCLPKDLRATMHMARTRDVEIPMLGAILASNKAHVDLAVGKIVRDGRKRIAMIGLSFKTGTDDLRESPLVTLAEYLVGKGYALAIHDPEVQLSRLLGANRRYIEAQLPHIGDLLRPTLEEVVRDADVIVLGLSHTSLSKALAAVVKPEQRLIDLVGLPKDHGLRCLVDGLCW